MTAIEGVQEGDEVITMLMPLAGFRVPTGAESG